MKKRVLALLLVFVMVFGAFSACGRGTPSADGGARSEQSDGSGGADGGDSDKDSGDKDTGDGNEASESASREPEASAGGDAASNPGSELSDFVSAYTDAKQMSMDKLSAKLENSTDFTLSMGLLGVAMVDLNIAFVPLFDAVDQTGFVPLLNLKNAYRKEKGGIITFGADYTRDEDSGQEKKGDRIFWDGKLDVKDQSLSFAYYTERGGKKVDRTVMEATKNKDGSYTSQTITFSAPDEGEATTTGYFITFEGEDIRILSGTRSDGNPDFDYETVFNKKNADIEALSKSFEISMDISFLKGEVKSNIKSTN